MALPLWAGILHRVGRVTWLAGDGAVAPGDLLRLRGDSRDGDRASPGCHGCLHPRRPPADALPIACALRDKPATRARQIPAKARVIPKTCWLSWAARCGLGRCQCIMDGVSGINTAISGRAAGEPSAPARPGRMDGRPVRTCHLSRSSETLRVV